jgi:antitoxin CcdA
LGHPILPSSAKRATNLSLSGDVLDAAKALGQNASQPCGARMRDVLCQEQESHWRIEHADFTAAHNATVKAEGLPLEAWRAF